MTALPHTFRHVRMILAREPGHPDGDEADGYDIVAPLLEDGRLDAEGWRAHRDRCRVRRFRPGVDDVVGVLGRKPGGQWFLDYPDGSAVDDEAGFRFGDEHFVQGEYVSVKEDDGRMHTFRIVFVRTP